MQYTLLANFANQITLLGYDLTKRRLQAGEALPVMVYWQGLHKLKQDYFQFNHLLDSQLTQWGGYDRVPRGTYLTSCWEPDVDTPLVLPVTSIVIAFAAVTIFMFFAPFPLWFKSLFIFTIFSCYEYSVMARNYGISMLLLFVGAMLYQHRKKYPLLLAFILALLANTNIHSAILVCLIAG